MSKFIEQQVVDRGIRRVVLCHADHFEPFCKDSLGVEMGRDYVDHWLKACATKPFAAKASLFWAPVQYSAGPNSNDQSVSVPNDILFFTPHRHAEEDLECVKMAASFGHDLHFHVHHEWWTSSDLTKLDGALDSARLRLFMSLHKARYGDLVFSPGWSFVHGCWALNASDKSVCRIEDEVQILKEFGCAGDFSFPAGRTHCDPDKKAPFCVSPKLVTGPKGYNNPVSQKDLSNVTEDFLIWSSSVPTDSLSLDLISTGAVDPDTAVNNWFSRGWVKDGSLYIKTHAHSLNGRVWTGVGETTTPFLTHPVNYLFKRVEAFCLTLDVLFEYCSIRQVLSELFPNDAANNNSM